MHYWSNLIEYVSVFFEIAHLGIIIGLTVLPYEILSNLRDATSEVCVWHLSIEVQLCKSFTKSL